MSDLVEFVDDLPKESERSAKWQRIRAELAGQPGKWARIDAKGGYPRQRLAALGCEVRVVAGQTYARWPS